MPTEYPHVARREGSSAIWVRMSAQHDDVIHLDLKPGERMTDREACEAANLIRHWGKLSRGR